MLNEMNRSGSVDAQLQSSEVGTVKPTGFCEARERAAHAEIFSSFLDGMPPAPDGLRASGVVAADSLRNVSMTLLHLAL